MDDRSQKPYDLDAPPPEKDLSTFSGWAVVFIIVHVLGILSSMGSCAQFTYSNGGVLSPSYLLMFSIGLILRISMLALLLRRNKWFRIPYYIEFGTAIFLYLFNGFPPSNLFVLVVSLLWLFYVIFSKRLKYITGELPKKTPSTWNQPPPPPLYESMAQIGSVPSGEISSPVPPVAPVYTAVPAAPPAMPQAPAEEKARFCKKCGTKVDESQTRCAQCGARTRLFAKKSAGVRRPVLIVLVVLLLVSVGGNIFQGVSAYQYEINLDSWIVEWDYQRQRADTTEQKLKDAESSATQLQSKLEAAESRADTNEYLVLTYKDKALFLDNRIAIVVPAIGNSYHRLNCPLFPSNYTFWAYNIEAAHDQGYYPCSTCY